MSRFAHTINLIVQSGLSGIEEVLVKVKNIVAYFKRSSHALSKLQGFQKQTGSLSVLVTKTKTRLSNSMGLPMTCWIEF